jgi:hypothetical protein
LKITSSFIKIKYSSFTELDCGFDATYAFPSTRLHDRLASKPLGPTWTESELKDCCDELGITKYFCNNYEHESLSSDCSIGQCHSETSLGKQIIAMAQDPQPAELPCVPSLELGSVSKRLTSEYSTQVTECMEKLIHSSDKYLDSNVRADDILCGEIDQVQCLTDKSQYLSESTHLGKKHILVASEPEGDNSHAHSMNLLAPMDSPTENEMFQEHCVNVVLDDMIITRKCSDLKNDIPMSTQYSFQSSQEGQNLNKQCQNVLELKHLCSQNPVSLNRPSNATDDVSSHIGDIKVQKWFSDPMCKNSEVPNSHICANERGTGTLIMNLAREQCNLDCSDSCENVGMGHTYEDDINTAYSGKPRREELNLECLVRGDDECGGSSSIKCSGIDTTWPVSKSHVNVQIQGEISHLKLKAGNNLQLPGQRPGDETDHELLEKASAHGGFEG